MSVKQQVFQRSIKALPHLIYKILTTLVTHIYKYTSSKRIIHFINDRSFPCTVSYKLAKCLHNICNKKSCIAYIHNHITSLQTNLIKNTFNQSTSHSVSEITVYRIAVYKFSYKFFTRYW